MLDVVNVVERRWRRREEWPRLVAYHEAGHAVVAIHYGWKFECVTTIPTWDYSGCLRGPRPPRLSQGEVERTEAYAVLLHGGGAAEAVVFGNDVDGSLGDQVYAWTRARRVFPDPAERAACLARARQQARELVLHYRPALEAVAGALWEARELDYGQTRRIVARAMAGRG